MRSYYFFFKKKSLCERSARENKAGYRRHLLLHNDLTRNVTIDFQHVEVLRYHGLSLQRFVWGKKLKGILAEILIFLNRAAVGWAVSCSAFGLFLFFFFVVLWVSRPKLPLGLLSSPDDVIISQLQAISQLFSSYLASGAFCQVSKLTIQKEHGCL